MSEAVDRTVSPDHDLKMFEAKPTARADMAAGTLYAVSGEAGWIYYGQVTPEKKVGFFCRRDRQPAPADEVLNTRVMVVTAVGYPSITRAVRTGTWKKLGKFPVVDALVAPQPSVHWPIGTLTVTVCNGDGPDYDTRVEDPAIQNMELMAAWDATEHIPARLTAEFGAEEAEWHIGGPIWRERRIMEERAVRFRDQPWHKLPDGWVPTETR